MPPKFSNNDFCINPRSDVGNVEKVTKFLQEASFNTSVDLCDTDFDSATPVETLGRDAAKFTIDGEFHGPAPGTKQWVYEVVVTRKLVDHADE